MEKQHDTRASAQERAYTWQWRKARRHHLIAHPLCVFCLAKGHTTAARVVDHITPHHGDQDLFWSSENWQSLCFSCHNSTKQHDERMQAVNTLDEHGWPTNPRHRANRAIGSNRKI